LAKILVTGGAGFVGSVCCLQLIKNGHQVVAVDNLSTGHPRAVPEGVSFYPSDIGDRDAISDILHDQQFDAVFHFAAKALIPESVTNPGLFFDENVASGIAFLESVRAAGINRFVFSSSAAVYGSPSAVPIEEDHPKNPVNSYGETKLMFERVLNWYATAYGWTVFAFRYFNACGATANVGEDHRPETHIIPLLLETAAGERPHFEIYGRDYPTPDGSCLRDYVHVLDIAEAHLLALDVSDKVGMTAYNIGTGDSHSVLEVCGIVEDVTGAKLTLREGPRRAGDPAVLCASPAKLMRELGWNPRFSDLREIVRTAWQWKCRYPQGYGSTEPDFTTITRDLQSR
jgi:UDP-glucose 4-epimerase